MNDKIFFAKRFLLALFVVSPLVAQSISRWGNGSFISHDGVLTASLPETVVHSEVLSNNKMTLVFGSFGMTPIAMTPVAMTAPAYLVISDFVQEYPEYKGLAAAQVSARLKDLNSNWKEQDHTSKAHVLILQTTNGNLAIVVWDTNQGIVLKGPRGAMVDDAITEILKSAKIAGKAL
jgi:hypothetical protein